MNTIERRNAGDLGLFDRLLRHVTDGLAEVKRIRKLRQSRAVTQHLLTHDDRILDDMGVSRDDVVQALSVGWNSDPAACLAELRRRRMQANRQGLIRRRVR